MLAPTMTTLLVSKSLIWRLSKLKAILNFHWIQGRMTGDISYMGKRKHVHDYVYDDVQPITCDFVPDDINGTTVYIVPLQASGKMNNWEYSQTSKSKSFTRGLKLLYNCRGSYCYTNVKCANITDFEINRLEFQQKEGAVICSLCEEKAA